MTAPITLFLARMANKISIGMVCRIVVITALLLQTHHSEMTTTTALAMPVNHPPAITVQWIVTWTELMTAGITAR
jgi:hypothetical protein